MKIYTPVLWVIPLKGKAVERIQISVSEIQQPGIKIYFFFEVVHMKNAQRPPIFAKKKINPLKS